jgi:hypothetical protein
MLAYLHNPAEPLISLLIFGLFFLLGVAAIPVLYQVSKRRAEREAAKEKEEADS